ncbi:uncharacterized protein LOC135464187 [Liolophura sinensis]|uniref:uncharacterized protein LOC135464187 n=1 Tax=Liolophura sinensis TaxID=3198878 RepID=UPI0031585C1E
MPSLWLCSFLATVAVAIPPPPPVDQGEINVVFRPNITQDDDAPVSFKYRYVAKNGAVYHSHPRLEVITIAATTHVSDQAMEKAAITVGLMIKHMQKVCIPVLPPDWAWVCFTKAEGLTVYPEMSSHTDTPSCHSSCKGSCAHTCISDGRKFSTIGGLTSRRSYVVDDNVLCNSHDAYHKTLNVLSHEFAHQIMFHLDKYWRERIHKAYNDIHAKGTWKLSSYAMRNQDEYFAEATTAFFLSSHMIGANGGMNVCGSGTHICSSVSTARAYLRQHDPEIFAVLEYVYTGNRPDVYVPLKTCM